MIGKLDPEALQTILDQTGASDPALLTGAAYGEDAAAIDLGDGETLVVSSDPVSLAAEAAGTIGVHVACNDIAAAGADPEFLTNVIFLPDDDAEVIETLTSQLDEAAADLGVTIVGGHTEYVPVLSRPLLSLTAFGRTDHHIPTSGAESGDRVLLTKGAAIEATGIIATDFADDLRDAGVDESTIDRAAGFFEEISILDDSRALRESATALHDPTEGGVRTGLVEMAAAADVDLVVDRESVPVRPETETVCAAMGIDPLGVFGSGALLATLPPAAVESARSRLAEAGIEAAVIGEVEAKAEAADSGALLLDGERITDGGTDELYPFWE
ncbi:AIR synthase family protein [Halohasta litorea]|uniref:AIR synthase family protein n=1 Tax=Halohasta litorea TaxID=869891 RepID=A0ABD6D619_9EURY|nr:AIR synthase family protein [Halohasta litorea]